MSVLPGFEDDISSDFSKEFLHTLAQELAIRNALGYHDIDGKEWEKILAECLGVEWKATNMPLIDVSAGSVGWSSKTVRGKNTVDVVKLISGRNSPEYEFGQTVGPKSNASEVGDLVLTIWNKRVSNAKSRFEHIKSAVLIRNKSLDEFAVFQKDVVQYDTSDYEWRWNGRSNLYGCLDGETKFTWQPHGSQFSIVESVVNPTKIHLHSVRKVPKKAILKFIDFTDSSYEIL